MKISKQLYKHPLLGIATSSMAFTYPALYPDGLTCLPPGPIRPTKDLKNGWNRMPRGKGVERDVKKTPSKKINNGLEGRSEESRCL